MKIPVINLPKLSFIDLLKYLENITAECSINEKHLEFFIPTILYIKIGGYIFDTLKQTVHEQITLIKQQFTFYKIPEQSFIAIKWNSLSSQDPDIIYYYRLQNDNDIIQPEKSRNNHLYDSLNPNISSKNLNLSFFANFIHQPINKNHTIVSIPNQLLTNYQYIQYIHKNKLNKNIIVCLPYINGKQNSLFRMQPHIFDDKDTYQASKDLVEEYFKFKLKTKVKFQKNLFQEQEEIWEILDDQRFQIVSNYLPTQKPIDYVQRISNCQNVDQQTQMLLESSFASIKIARKQNQYQQNTVKIEKFCQQSLLEGEKLEVIGCFFEGQIDDIEKEKIVSQIGKLWGFELEVVMNKKEASKKWEFKL